MTASQLSSARSWVLSPSLSMLPAEEQCSNSRGRLLMRRGEAPSVRTLRSRHTLQELNRAHDAARKPGPLASYPPYLASAAHLRLYPALHVAATTGMRLGELAGFRWGDWHHDTHRISIARSRQVVGGQSGR